MHMVWQQMRFDDAAFFLPRQLMEYRAKMFANVPKHRLAAAFRNEDDMVFAIPLLRGTCFGMIRTCRILLLGYSPSSHLVENSTVRIAQSYSSLTGRTSGLPNRIVNAQVLHPKH